MFADEQLSSDGFLGGRLQLLQPLKGYRAATDPVLLAAACPAKAGETVLDLGCGAGTAAFCLGLRVPGLTLSGLELQPAYVDLARRNAERNGIAFDVHEGDLSLVPKPLRRDFDHVIVNPPYYRPRGSPSPIKARAKAMQIETPLSDWITAACRRLSPGGWLTLICGADGLPEILSSLPPKLGSAAVLPLAARDGRLAQRILVQARKGGRAPFRLLAPFILHLGSTHDGDRESYTPEASAVLRNGADLLAHFH